MVRVVEGREDVSFLRHRQSFSNCTKYPFVVPNCMAMILSNFYFSILIILVQRTNTGKYGCAYTYLASRTVQQRNCCATRMRSFVSVMTKRIPTSLNIVASSRNDYDEGSDDEFARREASIERNGFDTSNKPYWDSSEVNPDDWQQPQKVPFQSNEMGDNDVLEWEKCSTSAGTAWVLLPPLSVTKPTCIVHFVGGTFMGSSPQIWYRTLLHDLVRHTSCAIVATSIPVTISRSPLNHVRLSSQLLEQFRFACQDIIADEYGSDTLQSIPICGIGHSLGARLLAVSTTITLGKIQPTRKGQISLSYKSLILISFTNYGAAAGIPGVATLFRKSRDVEQQKQRPRKATERGTDGKWWDDDDNKNNDNIFEDDENWSSLWDEISDVVQIGTTSIQNALTPPSKSFEFFPTPEQLWTALQSSKRYNITDTLIVQFDDDDIDQSSRLATSIMNCSDVKFARLRGTHLTPISRIDYAGDNERAGIENNDSFMKQINNRAERILVKTLQGRQESNRNEVAFLELRQSIARYIIEVVNKR